MNTVDVFRAVAVIGALIAMTSKGRVSTPELSRRMTGWGWLLVGMGLSGYAVFAPANVSSGWRQLEMIWHFGVGVGGMMFVLLGVRRLRRTADADRPPATDVRRSPALRRAWRLVWTGLALTITVSLVAMSIPGFREQDFDGTPRSLMLFGAVTLGVLLTTVGAVMLRRLHARPP